MVFHIDVNAKILTPIFTVLHNDSTLQGSTYLNGTLNVFKSKAPRDLPDHSLLIEDSGITDDDTSQWMGEVRVHIISELLSNGQIDVSRMSRIQSRVQELLVNEILTVSGAVWMPVESRGTIGPFNDRDLGNKARGVQRLWVNVGVND